MCFRLGSWRTPTGPMPVMISRGQMSVEHQSRATVLGQHVGMGAEQTHDLGFDSQRVSPRAPLRKTSVSGSAKVRGWDSPKTLVSVGAYHSFGGEVEASNTFTIRRLTPHAVTNFCHSSGDYVTGDEWETALK
jgi:hypothetical protein